MRKCMHKWITEISYPHLLPDNLVEEEKIEKKYCRICMISWEEYLDTQRPQDPNYRFEKLSNKSIG